MAGTADGRQANKLPAQPLPADRHCLRNFFCLFVCSAFVFFERTDLFCALAAQKSVLYCYTKKIIADRTRRKFFLNFRYLSNNYIYNPIEYSSTKKYTFLRLQPDNAKNALFRAAQTLLNSSHQSDNAYPICSVTLRTDGGAKLQS